MRYRNIIIMWNVKKLLISGLFTHVYLKDFIFQDIKSASVVGSVTKKKRRSKKRTKNAKHSLDGSDTEAQRIHHVENKLDDVIGKLSSREVSVH